MSRKKVTNSTLIKVANGNITVKTVYRVHKTTPQFTAHKPHRNRPNS